MTTPTTPAASETLPAREIGIVTAEGRLQGEDAEPVAVVFHRVACVTSTGETLYHFRRFTSEHGARRLMYRIEDAGMRINPAHWS